MLTIRNPITGRIYQVAIMMYGTNKILATVQHKLLQIGMQLLVGGVIKPTDKSNGINFILLTDKQLLTDKMHFTIFKQNTTTTTTVTLSSSLNTHIGKDKLFNVGIMVGQNFGRHYQTMEDLLGAKSFHNINTYAIRTYSENDPRIQYDLNTMGTQGLGALVYEGDKFGYDYNLNVLRGTLLGKLFTNFWKPSLYGWCKNGF